MAEVKQSISCTKCGHELPAEWISKARVDQVCDNCGATEQKISLEITEYVALQINDSMKAKLKDENYPSKKKVRKEVFAGDDYRASKGDYVDKLRVIDRDNDLYIEKIIDKQTGEVIHHNEEPLSEHYGHGAAKFKKD